MGLFLVLEVELVGHEPKHSPDCFGRTGDPNIGHLADGKPLRHRETHEVVGAVREESAHALAGPLDQLRT